MGAEFWSGLLAVMGINLLLAGDNAVVIALASRNLPAELQRRAIIYGSLAAIVLRIVLTAFVVTLMQVPALKFVGGLLLLKIAYDLAMEEENDGEGIDGALTLGAAIRTIVIADIV